MYVFVLGPFENFTGIVTSVVGEVPQTLTYALRSGP